MSIIVDMFNPAGYSFAIEPRDDATHSRKFGAIKKFQNHIVLTYCGLWPVVTYGMAYC